MDDITSVFGSILYVIAFILSENINLIILKSKCEKYNLNLQGGAKCELGQITAILIIISSF